MSQETFNKEKKTQKSEGGVKIVNKIYEGLGVNKVVDKMEIVYNQFWIDRYQKKALKFKKKMNDLDLKICACDQSKKRTESLIETLKERNLPGVESLQIKLQKLDMEKENLLNKKDIAQSKFETRENKLKLYTNERDRVADKLIRRYEEKLKPIEAELEKLQTSKDQIDLLIAVTEAKHNNLLVELSDIEKQKNELEESLYESGLPKEEIKEIIKGLENTLTEGRKRIRKEKEELAQRKAEINKKIAKIDAKANPYRDKREEFVRIKERRPIKIDATIRQRGKVFTGEEEITAHPRSEAKEKIAEDKEKLPFKTFIEDWNAFLKENYENAAQFIDRKDFLRVADPSLELEKTELSFNDFKNILKKYLKYRKLPMEQFNESIDKFYEKKVKVRK